MGQLQPSSKAPAKRARRRQKHVHADSRARKHVWQYLGTTCPASSIGITEPPESPETLETRAACGTPEAAVTPAACDMLANPVDSNLSCELTAGTLQAKEAQEVKETKEAKKAEEAL